MPRARRSAAKTSRRPSRSRKKSAAATDNVEQSGTLRPQWSGTLSFGLVSIPVDLYSATRSSRVSLRMLAPDGTPVARRFACPDEDRIVPSEELVRGYEYKPGKYVTVTDEELESLEPDKSRDIDLRLFVPKDSLDPVYFERTYFLTPSGDSNKAYHLLATVMERGERAGIATFVMRDREYLVAIVAQNGLLLAEALRFREQVRDVGAVAPKKARADGKRDKQLAALLDKLAHDRFDPNAIHDEHADGLRKLAEAKARKRKDVIEAQDVASEDGGDAETVDLMKLLKQSLK